MISDCQKTNVGAAERFRQFFKPRDIFFQDGTKLHRIHLGTRIQLGAAAALVAVTLWSVLAIAQIAFGAQTAAAMVSQRATVASMEADMATIRAETEAHAARLEKRQQFLAAVLAGKASPKQLEALLPREIADASDVAAPALAAFDRVEELQLAMLDDVQEATDQRYDQTRQALRKLGLAPNRFQNRAGRARSENLAGMGGPFEPVSAKDAKELASGKADPKFKSLFLSWKKLDSLQQGVIAVPSAQPVSTTHKFTSGFGVRSDPFRGTAAMHAGIDLAGPLGTPVYATADGVIGRAGWANGYGKLIEIDHGKGLQTRFGHLSEILVAANTRVKRGQLIGKMGSTGRSTGSHLHYEVRIDGRAVNPIPFLQTNEYLMAMQRRGTEGQVALGGPSD